MASPQTLKISSTMELLISRIKSRQEDIHRWLTSLEGGYNIPLYSSVDIRDAGFKTAVIDTNIFPAGFNNLCEHGLEDAVKFFKKAILKRVPNCQNILIVAEEHTRNTWYLENLRILEDTIAKAGFNVRVATFLSIQPDFCEKMRFVELETATGKHVRVHCFKYLLEKYQAGHDNFDLIILNNDLITGIPDVLKNSTIPIYPSSAAGWHSRLKANHFFYANQLISEFAKLIDLDPWLVSCLFESVDDININVDTDRERLYIAAEKLLKQIQEKYKQHNITEKPYLVIKANAGTYGMGVMVIEDLTEIKEMNRRDRNKLFKGKGSQEIHSYLIQEGVPTIQNVCDKVSEVCIYQVENNLIGGFYRSNSEKGARENLNSSGMEFHKICPHSQHYGDCVIHPDVNLFDVYRILARIAGIAARLETKELEASQK